MDVIASGLWFEDFEVGLIKNHSITRTITESDFEKVSFPAPLFHGDTIRVESEILATPR